MKAVFRRLIDRYGKDYSTATIYSVFVILSLLAAVVLFGILRSTGVMRLVFPGDGTYVRGHYRSRPRR